MAGSPQVSQLLATALSNWSYSISSTSSFCLLMYVPVGAGAAAAVAGEVGGILAVFDCEGYLGFLDWVGDAKTVAGYAVAFRSRAGPFEALAALQRSPR